MNPFVSASETAIRDAVVARLRQLYPTARIIHELTVGNGANRVDVAAVTDDTLVLVEIKSERDKLKRLPDQIRAFAPVCHHLIIAAHERWCSGSKYPNCDAERIIRFNNAGHLWRYPSDVPWQRPWVSSIPWHHRMLKLLWTEELRDVGTDHGLAHVARYSGVELANVLAKSMTGAQIELAVCHALRRRQFAEADPPAIARMAA